MKDEGITLDEHKRRTTKPRFKLVPFNEVQITTERNYLVKGLIPREGLTVLWGPPKCGKSFLAFDMVMCVALGREYRGRHVHNKARWFTWPARAHTASGDGLRRSGNIIYPKTMSPYHSI